MKYIKTYESTILKKGDYACLWYPDFWKIYPFVKIIKKRSDSYYIEVIKNNKIDYRWVQSYDLRYKLRKEEREEYEIKKAVLKYNL